MIEPTASEQNPDPQDVIREIAATLPARDRHAPFMKLVLGWSYFECVFGRWQFENTPLTEDAMRYIAAHWNDEGGI
jgi:hypothetical protein